MKGVKAFATLLFVLAASAQTQQQQLRPGNFNISVQPTAVLQAGAEIRFDINVKDPLRNPVNNAQVTLLIETPDHQDAKLFKATQLAPGVYMTKPVFPAKGRWNVDVEVRRNDAMSARTFEYYVEK